MTAVALPTFNFGYPKGILQNFGVATGKESQEIENICIDSFNHSVSPLSVADEIPEVRFFSLKAKWEQETGMLSSDIEISLNPSYQEIIGMGKEAIPLILNEMKNKSGHWFWALKSISREDPVPVEIRGNIKKMTEAWLYWGESKGYI